MKTVGELFSSSILRHYYDKAHQLTELNRAWRSIMQDWADNSQIANFEAGELVVQVESGSIATRLRYSLPDILKKLAGSSHFAGVTRIQCIVRANIEALK